VAFEPASECAPHQARDVGEQEAERVLGSVHGEGASDNTQYVL
jgi:hypothetical protein